jgi:drug/metabolite transporter (DMT)-like permease
MTQRMGSDGRWVGGAVLIIIGVALLVGQWVPDVGRYATLIVGLALLALFVLTRNPGALIGGSIVTGIGAGILLEETFPATAGGWVPLGLGFGFLGIWLVGSLFRLPEARFWPLIPGGILVFVGLAGMGGGAADLLRYAWPVVLILAGLAVIFGGRRRRPPDVPLVASASPAEEPPPADS